MPLIYVTQVIYTKKININRPSPEDETVSHPNQCNTLYPHCVKNAVKFFTGPTTWKNN